MVERSNKSLARENGILRGLVRLQAQLINEIMNALPEEWQQLPNVIRAKEIGARITDQLDTLDGINGHE